jgi:hypothetical protein
MKTKIKNSVKWVVCAALFTVHYPLFTGCSDMLNTESDLVEFEADNTLDHATDSVYSVLGLVNKMQYIADRTVLLGEVRGDLVVTTDAASDALQRLSNFDFSVANKYNAISDYYAVINNCNYFIAHVDTSMVRHGRNVFKPEYAVAKAFRAWTYLQLALNYEKVPLILNPLMTEKEAREAMNQTPVDLKTICDTFVDDLAPLADINMPVYGTILNSVNSQKYFIPIRVLLGDLCLWGERYREAAQWYHDYLTDKRDYIHLNLPRSTWGKNPSVYNNPSTSYRITDDEIVTLVPMETSKANGVMSELDVIYNSSRAKNYNYYELTYSPALQKLSADQTFTTEVSVSVSPAVRDTLVAPHDNLNSHLWKGDLRLASIYNIRATGEDELSEYGPMSQSISKISSSRVNLYRKTMIYLRYAEALNRAELPQSAMVVLKYGMCQDNVLMFVDAAERAKAGSLVFFDTNEFKLDNGKTFEDGGYDRYIYGIHSNGSGDAHANKEYGLSQTTVPLNNLQDSIEYVENLIIDEMALEGSFEGNRFYDLMRVALRRNNPAYLADPISKRKGSVDAELYSRLLNTSNWYLPLD